MWIGTTFYPPPFSYVANMSHILTCIKKKKKKKKVKFYSFYDPSSVSYSIGAIDFNF